MVFTSFKISATESAVCAATNSPPAENGPGALRRVEDRARAVGPSLALAQVEVQAIEAAAQDQVHDHHREIVRVGPLDADQADADRRLRARRPCR